MNVVFHWSCLSSGNFRFAGLTLYCSKTSNSHLINNQVRCFLYNIPITAVVPRGVGAASLKKHQSVQFNTFGICMFVWSVDVDLNFFLCFFSIPDNVRHILRLNRCAGYEEIRAPDFRIADGPDPESTRIRENFQENFQSCGCWQAFKRNRKQGRTISII